MKMGTWVALNKSGFRNNTGDWKAHLEMSERERTGKTPGEASGCVSRLTKSNTVKEHCPPSDFSFPLTQRAGRQPHRTDNSWCPSPYPKLSVYQPPLLRNVALLTVQTSIPRDNYNHSLSSKNSLPKCTMPSFLHTRKQLGAHSWTPLRSLWERVLERPTRQAMHTYWPTLLCTRQCTKFFVWTDS